jgi:hypothetical protein
MTYECDEVETIGVIHYMTAIVLRIVSDCMGGMAIDGRIQQSLHVACRLCRQNNLWSGYCFNCNGPRKLICGFIIDGKLQKLNPFSPPFLVPGEGP